MALVSVVAGCFNHVDFVGACLRSVYAQDFEDWELVVVDDGSSDGSPEVIKAWLDEFGDSRARLVRLCHGGCVSRTFNLGIRETSGEFVACVSTDDVLEPHRLKDQVRSLEAAGPQTALVYSDMYLMDSAGRRLPGLYFGESPDGTPEIRKLSGAQVFSRLLRHNAMIAAPTVLVRRQAMKAVGTYDESLSFEDTDMWLRIASRFEIMFSEYVSMSYRLVPTSLTNQIFAGGPLQAEYYNSMLTIYNKWRDHVSLEDHDFIVRKQGDLAWLRCAMGERRGMLEYLTRALRAHPTLRNLARLVVAATRISPAVRRMSAVVRQIPSGIRSCVVRSLPS